VLLTAAVGSGTDSQAATVGLPLGDSDLIETRTTQVLARGVTLTRIVRGSEPASPDDIPTTRRGPWRVNVLGIDPDAPGHLAASYGPDLARAERTTELVAAAGALAGVNASFFTFAADPRYPGEPVGLGLYHGALLSEPAASRGEVDMVIDARTDDVLFGPLTWFGRMTNRRTGRTLRLEFLNHPPVVPPACSRLTDQTRCEDSGDVVHFSREFGRSTPPGLGVEVVLGPAGCVVTSTTSPGTRLAVGQTAVQATGRQTRRLLRLTERGCLTRRVRLMDPSQRRLRLHRDLFGVAGRYQLVTRGRLTVPTGTGDMFARNPRTIAGTATDGTIMLVTIDGRRPTSVGTTLSETAAAARSLGMHDAINLDGGGSTTMSVRGDLVNRPSSTAGERAVGDALIYLNRPPGS
jgi:hypothetical protein